jgi:hypothetical protein
MLPLSELPALRTIVVLGEQCPAQLVALWGKGRRLYNAYGPTEASMWVSGTEVDGSRKPPIGRPILNTQLYILDEYLEPVPVGLPGEIFASGVGLARGYCNRPELTAASFIPNPFSSEPGSRMYRTGDIARYLPDGNIELLGRRDHQVKLRGYRIETGEIEAVLARFQSVRDTVVLPRQNASGEPYLVAYVVLHPEYVATISEIRAFLGSRLPEYMIPSAFVMVEELPLTANGKLDIKALPIPDNARFLVTESYVAPRNAVERVIAGIWSDVLGLEGVGALDNFFELSGHSLLGLKVMSRVRDAFESDAPLRMLFLAPTVEAFAVELIARSDGSNRIQETAELILRVAEMNESELDSLLSNGETASSAGGSQ